MTYDRVFTLFTVLCLGYCVFMAGAIWQQNKSHKEFMTFIETSEITKYGKYQDAN